METDAPLAPPVVAVVVVHAPGPWFDEALASLAAQDYPNLNTLFLLTTDVDAAGGDVAARILARLPGAFVRPLDANPGFGPAANEVLRLVEGDSGFFCFCHDDVALDPDAVRMLVEEVYRSNAGIVGPKLVQWDEPGVLQHVGLDMDRFGEIDTIVEPGETDQEQHDAVRDVFVLPTACLLVRADLFRALGGFDPAVTFHGDDVDLCWRAHLSGARVVVAPQARVRHREELELRRPDLNHAVLRARHRMRSVATLTSGSRLFVRSIELVFLTLAELVVGLFTGRFGEAWASLRAFVGLVPRAPALLARRGAVAKLREVPDSEVIALQDRGSARLTSYLRSRDTATYVGDDITVRRWRESSLASVILWIVVVSAILLASRTLINAGVPSVGEFLPFPDSPRDWWRDFRAGWNPNGFGSTSANPTGWGLLAIASVAWGFRMSLGFTVVVVGLVVAGAIGMWRLATVFPATRARATALVVYLAVPLLPGVMSLGRFSALVTYAAVPWFVHLTRSAVGVGTADPEDRDERAEAILAPTARERVRRTAVLAILVAVAVALAPPAAVVLALVAVVLGLSTLAAGSGLRASGWFAGLGLLGVVGGLVLNWPWITSLSWDDLAAPTLAGAPDRGLVDVASMAVGRARLEVVALSLYVPLVVALAVARSWRLTWAARAAGLVATFLLLAVLQDRDRLPFDLPEIGVLLAPLAVGLALGAATAVAAFGDDVAGRTFGWRQPAGLLAYAAVVVGCFPVVLTAADGAWFAPRTTLGELTDPYLASSAAGAADAAGDHRVLFLGDPRVLPVPSHDLGNGVAMAVVDDGPIDFRDRWPAADTSLDDALAAVLVDIAGGQTARGGRLLAPFGIRYIVVPAVDGAVSTAEQPLAVATGLVDAFEGQLDIVSERTPASFAVFRNTAAIPTTAVLPAAVAEASTAETGDVLVALDTSGATPVFEHADRDLGAVAEVAAGTIHLGVAPDDAWQLEVGGQRVEARRSFGATTAFDVATAGSGELRYATAGSRTVALVIAAALWIVALALASRVATPGTLRRQRRRDETLIDLGTGPSTIDLPDPRGGEAQDDDWVDALWVDDERGGGRP